MAKVTYKPEPGTPARHTQFGVEFGPEPVDVTDKKVLAKVRGNPFYEVVGDGETEPPQNSTLVARHRGRGVYGVFDGDIALDAIGQMTKGDAEAFNAMSDAEKAAFIDNPATAT